MTPQQIKRGFRRIGLAFFGLFGVGAVASLTIGAYLFAAGPSAYCPGSYVSRPVGRQHTDATVSAFRIDCLALPWSDQLYPNATPVDSEYAKAFQSGLDSWTDKPTAAAGIAAGFLIAGAIVFGLIELLGWIVRGFMRE